MGFAAAHRQGRPELPALTSLRFIAALAVVLAHLADRHPLPAALSGFASCAYQAVIFFFVLSGFVLVYANVPDASGRLRPSLWRFWWSRFARVAPAYYASVVLILPFLLYGAIAAGTISAERLWVTVAAILTFLPGLFIPDVLAWNPPAWSLGVEVCLYAAFPFLIVPCLRLPFKAAVMATLALLVLSVVVRIGLIRSEGVGTVYHFPLFYLPHFVMGILAARLFLFGPKLSERGRVVMFIGAALGALAVAAVSTDTSWTYSDLALAPLSVLVILGASATAMWPIRLLSHRALHTLGEASYAVYILHWPLYAWLRELEKVTALPAWLEALVYLFAVVAASLLTFFLIERPLRARLLGLAHTRPARD